MVSAVAFLIPFLRDGVPDASVARVGAKATSAVGLVRVHMIGQAARPAPADAGYPDAFEQWACAEVVVALAGGEQDDRRGLGEVNRSDFPAGVLVAGDQSAPGLEPT
jgi:hypothetical protein